MNRYQQRVIDRQLVRAYPLIMNARQNPCTGAKMGKVLKLDLFRTFGALLRLQSFEQYTFDSKKYHCRITVKCGQIRKSWDTNQTQVRGRTGKSLSVKTVQRHCKVLDGLGVLKVIFERPTYAGLPSAAEVKGLIELKKNKFRGFKLLQVPFPEIVNTLEIDNEILTKVNQILIKPMKQSQTEDLSEEIIADLQPIPQNEVPTSPRQPKICPSAIIDLSITHANLPVPDAALGYCRTNSEVEWQVEVCVGGVGVKRVTVPRGEIPERVDGEFYASWIGESSGAYYTPWIIWDIDADSDSFIDVLKARDRANALVKSLQAKGVPESAIRIVFSTRRGFHVYLDSRCVGLKPSPSLHAQVKAFCLTLAKCDPSLYALRHIIGIPNSRHRITKLYYASVPIKGFWDASYPELRCLCVFPQHFEPLAEEQAVVPALAAIYASCGAPEVKRSTGIPEVLRRALEPVPEYFGVSEGARDRAVHYLCKYYRRMGLTQPETFDLVSAANARNIPPLPVEIIREKVLSAYAVLLRREQNESVPF